MAKVVKGSSNRPTIFETRVRRVIAMGWFDLFFRPLAPQRYADAMMDELKRQGDKREWRFDAANFRLLSPSERGAKGQPRVWSLANLYEEYKATPRKLRKEHFVLAVERILSIPDDAPSDFEDVRPHLRPKLWVRASLEKARLQGRLDWQTDHDSANAPIEVGTHLRGGLVYDMPTSVMSLSAEHLKEWGVSFYEAYEIACANLMAAKATFAPFGEGLYIFISGDSYDSTRILAHQILEQLEVKGRRIAMAPSRDLLLVAGEDDDKALETMLEVAAKSEDAPRPMSPVPVVWDDDRWVDWLPPRGHPLRLKFAAVERKFLWREYDDQKRLLDALYQKTGIDRFVASYTVAEHQVSGEQFSYAVWTEGVETLLPTCDRIVFAQQPPPKESGNQPVMWWADWIDVERVLSSRLNDAGLYPARVLVDWFPSPEELKAVRAHKK
jgi:hypothetical protein